MISIELEEYAVYLGMDPVEDADLIWIAKEGFMASVPEPWMQCENNDGETYFFNKKTNQATWSHPLDAHYKELYQKEKAKKMQGAKQLTNSKTGKVMNSKAQNTTPNTKQSEKIKETQSVKKDDGEKIEEYSDEEYSEEEEKVEEVKKVQNNLMVASESKKSQPITKEIKKVQPQTKQEIKKIPVSVTKEVKKVQVVQSKGGPQSIKKTVIPSKNELVESKIFNIKIEVEDFIEDFIEEMEVEELERQEQIFNAKIKVSDKLYIRL